MKNIPKRRLNSRVRMVYSLMIFSMFLPMLNFSLPLAEAQALTIEPEQCTQSIDTVVVMDVSNSMGECTGTTTPLGPIDPTGFGKSTCGVLGGSWSDTLLVPAKSLANYYVDLVDSEDPNDTIGLVSFATTVTPEVALGDDGIAVGSTIAALDSGQGGTNMAAGIDQALVMLSTDGQDNADKKIIIFSDGDADDDISTAFATASSAGVKVYVFDMDTESGNDDILPALALSTGGDYYDDTATTADLDYVYDSNKNIECPVEPDPVFYCGNDEVDQEWEQCDGDVGCTDQCQWEEQDQCSDLVLARVNIDDVQNGLEGDMTSDVYLGTSDYSIPAGTWFPLYWNGSYYTDDDITGYEDVPGLAVQRLEGSVRAVLYGSRQGNNTDIKEHVDGNIEFYNASVVTQRDDSSGNNRLENDENNSDHTVKGGMAGAGNDEVWLEDGNNTQSFFWLTTTTADDGYYTDWNIIEDCSDILTVCKQDVTGAPQSGWEMNVQSGNNLVGNGGFETPVVTDHSGQWELFDSSEVGWNIEWVNTGIDDEPVLELQSVNLWAPDEGEQYAELDTHYYNPVENPPRGSVSISQDIVTVPGNSYNLSFAFSPRPGIVDNKLQVEFGAIDEVIGLGIDGDGSGNNNTDWNTYSYTFVATDNVTTLRFTDLSVSDSLGTFLDDVQVYETVSGITRENGCYEFRNLEYGDYTVTETMQEGWMQVEPQEGFFNIAFNEQNNPQTVTFVNDLIPPTTGDICVRKFNDDNQDGQLGEDESMLPDWNFELTRYLETVEVDAMGSVRSTTVDITPGKTYLLVAEGTYTYINNNTTSGLADAEWSDRPDFSFGPGWIAKGETEFNNPNGLDVMVDNTNIDWGDYNPLHVYNHVYTAVNNSIDFHIEDNQYSDNYITDGDPIRVSIYEYYTDSTDDNGEYCFTDLEFDDYNVAEIMQDGWFNSTPVSQSVSLDENNTPVTVYFGNYQESTGDSICGYKYEVNEQGEELGVLSDWPMSLWSATEVLNFEVPADDIAGYTPDFSFESGKTYKIEVTGTAWANDGIYFDAKYSERNDSGSWTDEVQNYESYGSTLLDLQIDGISPDWGDYNYDHTYFIVREGDDSAWNFTIYDIPPYSNNEGSLSVIVYELTNATETTTTNDNGYYCFEDLDSGHYVVQEGSQEGYSAYGSEYCQIADTSLEDNLCNFYNYEIPATTGTVTACKYNDEDADGDPEDDHPFITDWTMTIMQDDENVVSGDTDDVNGCVSFELEPGVYEVHEAMYDDWIQSYPTADGGYDYFTVVVEAGSEETVSFFNRQPNGGSGGPDGECTENCGSSGGGGPITGGSGSPTSGGTGSVSVPGCIDISLTPLSLSGSDPIVYNPGGQAKFQITITNSCTGLARNAIVTNTLPNGFTFSDSGVSVAAIGDVGIAALSSDGSTQDWNAGDVASGASWTTTYNTNIDSAVTAGDYINIANVRIDGNGSGVFAEDQLTVNITETNVLGFEYSEPEPVVKVLGYELLPETGGGDISYISSQTRRTTANYNILILTSLIMVLLGATLFIKSDGYER